MDPIQEILSILESADALTSEQESRLAELYAALEDNELAELETALQDAFDALRAEDVTPESVVILSRIADTVDGVRALAGERIAEAEAAAAAEAEAVAEQERLLAELDGRVHASADEGEPEPETEPETEPVAETEPEPEPEPEAEPVVEPEPVAAAATTAAPRATRAAIAARQPASHAPIRTRPRAGSVTMRGVGRNASAFDNRVEVEDELLARWRDLEGTDNDGRHRVAQFATSFPTDRVLPEGRITDVTELVQEIRARVSEEGGIETLTADGGICGPVDVWRETQSIAQASRPLRAVPAQYQAAYGGIRFMSPITIADIGAATTPTGGNAIGVVTEAQDAASSYDKSYQTIDCGTETEKRIDAVYRQLQFGNFIDRTNPNRVSQFTDMTLAAYARFNEQRLFNAMVANSTPQLAGQLLGASRDLINNLNRSAINYRARHRMDVNAQLETVLPAWVGMGLLPEDQVNALQSYPEQFDVNAAWIESKLAAKNIRVANWFQDDFTTALTEGGQVPAYPTSFTALLFHPGAHVYVDQGTLDLGVVRDSTLNVSNVFRTFAEEFWTTAMWGVESLAITMSLCANGASAGSLQPACNSYS